MDSIPPVFPDVPSARQTYCPLLSYTIALSLPLKIPNAPRKTVLGSYYFPCSDPINVASGLRTAYVTGKTAVISPVSMDDNNRAQNHV